MLWWRSSPAAERKHPASSWKSEPPPVISKLLGGVADCRRESGRELHVHREVGRVDLDLEAVAGGQVAVDEGLDVLAVIPAGRARWCRC